MINLTSFLVAVINFTVLPLFTENYFTHSRAKTETSETIFLNEALENSAIVFFTKNTSSDFKEKFVLNKLSLSEREPVAWFSYMHSSLLTFYPTGFT
ncbi:MAG: hypothetical protein NTW62_00875 [Candidatus Nomurabacteria bacterium]|nr:hypothetical protein [Candidatus Nomurabacteria bacterium]